MEFGLNKVESVIVGPLSGQGYGIVKIEAHRQKNLVVEILIERIDGQCVSIEDCKRASNLISAILDVEDVFHDKYLLEVSSAGIERPLIKLEDFERFAGNHIFVKLKENFEGRKQVKGLLLGIEDQNIKLQIEGTSKKAEDEAQDGTENAFLIPHDLISKSNIIMTEELYRKILNKQEMEVEVIKGNNPKTNKTKVKDKLS